MEVKRAKVYRLPTENASNAIISNNGTVKKFEYHGTQLLTQSYLKSIGKESYHLYFTTDDKIEIEDWYYNSTSNRVYKCTDDQLYEGDNRKIVATTNENLKYTDHRVSPVPNFMDLPQPSKAFIEKYCKVGGIDEVLIEYVNRTYTEWANGNMNPKDYCKIKLDSHNTITIHPIKDSWSREEMIDNIKKALWSIGEYDGIVVNSYPDGTNSGINQESLDKWLDKNIE